jgi:hypothetical protein
VHKFSKKSFTLIEMLMVTSLLAVTGLAIYHSLVNGIKVWQISNRHTQEEDIAIFFDKVSQDLHNAFPFSLIKFDGKENKFSFATNVRTLKDRWDPNPEYINQIGRVEYQFNKPNGTLSRRQANYGQAVNDKFDPSRPVVRLVKDVKFAYYVVDGDKIVAKKRTSDQWPVGILIEITFADQGEQDNIMSKFITIPSGNRL